MEKLDFELKNEAGLKPVGRDVYGIVEIDSMLRNDMRSLRLKIGYAIGIKRITVAVDREYFC